MFLYQVLGVYITAFSIFMGLLSVRISGSLILVPSLGLISFCWFALSSFYVIDFVLSSFILLHFTISQKPSSFLVRDRKVVDSDQRGDGEEL